MPLQPKRKITIWLISFAFEGIGYRQVADEHAGEAGLVEHRNSEPRIHYGSGYGINFQTRGYTVLVLLCWGIPKHIRTSVCLQLRPLVSDHQDYLPSLPAPRGIGFKTRQTFREDVPHDVSVNLIEAMAQPVAQPLDRPPRLLRQHFVGSVSQSECRLADAFQAAFNRIVSKVVVL